MSQVELSYRLQSMKRPSVDFSQPVVAEVQRLQSARRVECANSNTSDPVAS